MRWHYKEIEKRKGVRYNDCRSVTNPPTKNRKVSLLGTGGKKTRLSRSKSRKDFLAVFAFRLRGSQTSCIPVFQRDARPVCKHCYERYYPFEMYFLSVCLVCFSNCKAEVVA